MFVVVRRRKVGVLCASEIVDDISFISNMSETFPTQIAERPLLLVIEHAMPFITQYRISASRTC